MLLTEVLNRLDKVSQRGVQYTALCPAHDDRKPSLAITEKSGKILVKCWSGCTTGDITSSLGLQLKDLFTESNSSPSKHQQYAKKKNKHQLRQLLSFELLMLFWIQTSRISDAELARDTKFKNARPEFVSMPEECWEREVLAVKRIREALNELYKNR